MGLNQLSITDSTIKELIIENEQLESIFLYDNILFENVLLKISVI